MKKKQQGLSDNYLERIPYRVLNTWSLDENGIVTLEMENKGVWNNIFQKLFHKPKISYVHLEKSGSYLWQQIDGKLTIAQLSEKADEEFGHEKNRVYGVAEYMRILESYHFIAFQEHEE